MKLLILSILMLFLIASNTYAQNDKPTSIAKGELNEDESIYLKQGMFDGNAWKSSSDREKGAYLLGYEDGVMNTAIQHISNKGEKDKAIGELPTSAGEISLNALIEQVDNFYLDDKNFNIPVPYVLLIIRNRIKGVDKKEINEYIVYLRKRFKE